MTPQETGADPGVQVVGAPASPEKGTQAPTRQTVPPGQVRPRQAASTHWPLTHACAVSHCAAPQATGWQTPRTQMASAEQTMPRHIPDTQRPCWHELPGAQRAPEQVVATHWPLTQV